MPQGIPLQTSLINKAMQDANRGIKTVTSAKAPGAPGIPDWLVDLVVPPDAQIDPTDAMNPMGSVMSKGLGPLGKLGMTLLKRFRGGPTTLGRLSDAKPLPIKGPTDSRITGLPPAPPTAPVTTVGTGGVKASEDQLFDTLRDRMERRRVRDIKNPPQPKPRQEPLKPYDRLRGSAISKEPTSFDGLLVEDVDNMHDNIGGKGSQAGHSLREGETWKDRIPGQQTFSGLDEYGDPTSEAGLEFMRDFNDLQWRDNQVTGYMDNLFNRNAKQRIQYSIPEFNRGAYEMEHAKQGNLMFGPGAPLFTASSEVPPYKANEALGTFNRAFKHLRDSNIVPPGVEPSDLVKRVEFTPGEGGLYSSNSKSFTAGVEDPTTIGHELRHAADDFTNPRMFDDYPVLNGVRTVDEMPPRYWIHPTEVNARATGNISDLLDESAKTGQQTLPGDFLEQFGGKLSQMEGDLNADRRLLKDNIRQNAANDIGVGKRPPTQVYDPYAHSYDRVFPEYSEDGGFYALNPSKGSAPKPQSSIPQYRSKSGMAVDVMDELKATPPPAPEGVDPKKWKLFMNPELGVRDLFDAGVSGDEFARMNQANPSIDNMLQDFADYATTGGPNSKGLPYRVGSAASDLPLTGPESAGVNELKKAAIDDDPVGYVGMLRSEDELATRTPAETNNLRQFIAGSPFPEAPMGQPNHVDALVQKLADYFTTPRFDPFIAPPAALRQINPNYERNAKLTREAIDKFGPKHDK